MIDAGAVGVDPFEARRALLEIAPIEIPGEDHVGGAQLLLDPVAVIADGDVEVARDLGMIAQRRLDPLGCCLEDRAERLAVLDMEMDLAVRYGRGQRAILRVM
jgi:hypothetical protein